MGTTKPTLHFSNMQKSQYDSDCTTWFPKGEIVQVEYAENAVKQGSVCLGLRSNTHAVLCTIKRNPTELACYQEKVFKIHDKMAMAISGLTADARILCKYMRREALTHQSLYSCQIPPKSLISQVSRKYQNKTYVYGKRPFGVGLLTICHDQQGPHVFENKPSGDFFEYHGYSIGDKSQSSRTYMETQMARLKGCDLNTLIMHGLKALKSGYRDDEELTGKNVEVAVVGADGYTKYSEEEINGFLNSADEFDPENQMMVE